LKRATELSEIVHPNCTHVVGIYRDLCTVVEEGHPNETDLLSCLRSKCMLSKTNRNSLLVQICSGLQYLHSRNPPVVHSCIKASSIILSSDLHAAKVSVACAMCPESTEDDIRYAAPELLTGTAAASLQSDVYSLGIVLFELLTGECAWDGLAPSEIRALVQQGRRPLLPWQIPPAFKALLAQCWAHDPHKRVTASSAWLQFYMLHSKESHENDPLRLFPPSFRTSAQTVVECLRGALSARILQSVILDMPIIDEFYATPQAMGQARLHGLSEIEAKCIMAYSHDACASGELLFHKESMLAKQQGQLRLSYGRACRKSDDEAVAKFQHFSFHLLSAMQKLPDLALGSRAILYAAFDERLQDLHESYSTQGAVVCWHFLVAVHHQRDTAFAELSTSAGGTIFEICGLTDAVDIAPLSLPRYFVRQRYAKRCIVAFYRYKCKNLSRSKYVHTLRQWRTFLMRAGRGESSKTCELLADHNSCFRVENALTWSCAVERGLDLPRNVDLVVLTALPNPLSPSAMLSSANGVAPHLAPKKSKSADSFDGKLKNAN
jgi:hypothetical protein